MRRSLILVLTMLCVACGVPLDAEPRPYPDDVGLDAVDLPESPGTVLVDQYFVSEGALVPVPRGLPSADPGTVARSLVAAPGAELPDVRSAIPPGTSVRSVVVRDGVASVDLTEGFALVGGDEEILAVGQIVLTLGGLDGIEGVRLSLDGTPVDAPVGEGELTDRPLVPADFATLTAGSS